MHSSELIKYDSLYLLFIVFVDNFVKQLRKEGRRNEYERHKLQALNQRQKMVSTSLVLASFFIICPISYNSGQVRLSSWLYCRISC